MAAHNEARSAGNDAIQPEHLILGLLSEPEALAARVLMAQGLVLDEVRATVTSPLPAPAGEVPDLVPYDASARKALELTYSEALRLGHNYIGTEHILLALLEREAGTGILARLGIEKPSTEGHVASAVAAAQAALWEPGSASPAAVGAQLQPLVLPQPSQT